MTAAGKAMARASRADASSRLPGKAPAGGTPRGGVNRRLQALLPKLVLSPSVFLVLVFVYGFIAFTGYLSFTGSRILPSFELTWIKDRTIRRHPGTAYPAGMRTSRPYHR